MKLLWHFPLIQASSRQIQKMNKDVLRMCCSFNLSNFQIDKTISDTTTAYWTIKFNVWYRRHHYTFFFKGEGGNVKKTEEST